MNAPLEFFPRRKRIDFFRYLVIFHFPTSLHLCLFEAGLEVFNLLLEDIMFAL